MIVAQAGDATAICRRLLGLTELVRPAVGRTRLSGNKLENVLSLAVLALASNEDAVGIACVRGAAHVCLPLCVCLFIVFTPKAGSQVYVGAWCVFGDV